MNSVLNLSPRRNLPAGPPVSQAPGPTKLASESLQASQEETFQSSDQQGLSSKEAALHYAVTGATVVGSLVGAAAVSVLGASAGSAGLAAIGLGLMIGAGAAVVGGVANGVRGYKAAKQVDRSVSTKLENAANFGVSAAVMGTAAVGAVVLAAFSSGPGALGALILAPAAGSVAGAVAGLGNAVRGWNLKA